MFVTLKISEAMIGKNVKARKPISHGDRKMRPQRASFLARADLPSDGRRNQPRRPTDGGITGWTGTAAKRPPRVVLRPPKRRAEGCYGGAEPAGSGCLV